MSEGESLERYVESWPTERETLRDELEKAQAELRASTGWFVAFGVGPATLLAVVLALVFGHVELLPLFAGLGAAAQGVSIWRARRRVRDLERALLDPMDGS